MQGKGLLLTLGVLLLLLGTTTVAGWRTEGAESSSEASSSEDGFCTSENLWNVTDSALLCDFVEEYCGEPFGGGFINYLKLRYCHDDLVALLWPFFILMLLVLLYMLGDTADNYFCPALTRISTSLKLSPNVAGVTFLALGNGAPDISSIMAGIISGSGADIGIAEPVGAGVFVTTAVMALCTLVAGVKVTRRPFIRDVLIYLISVIVVWIILGDGKITLVESLLLLVVYVLYVLVVLIGRFIYQTFLKQGPVEPDEINRSSTIKYSGAGNSYNTPLLKSRSFLYRTIHSDEVPAPLRETLYRFYMFKYRAQAKHDLIASHVKDTDEPIDYDTIPELDPEGYELTLAESLQQERERVEWGEKNILQKALFVLFFPVWFLCHASIPPSSTEPEEWSKFWACLCPIFAPQMVLIFTQNVSALANGIALAVGVGVSVLIYTTTTSKEPPAYSFLFAVVAFGMSVMWIFAEANEVVNLLQSLGIMLNISQTTLTVTVLAWGNSLGDAVADLAVSRQGLGSMAAGAIYGGQLMNLLLGLGMAFLYKTATEYPEPFVVKLCSDQAFTFFTLVISLSLALLVVPLLGKFSAPRWLAVVLLAIYVTYLVLFLLYEANTVEFDWVPFPSSYGNCPH